MVRALAALAIAGLPIAGAPAEAAEQSRAVVQLGVSHGVSVFRREGPQAAPIELYAVGEIDAPPERVLAVLLDYERHPQFVRNLAQSRVLRRSAGELWVYQRLRPPVISDRDFTIRVTWGKKGSSHWLRFAADGRLGPPPTKGVVRVSLHEGQWLLEPVPGRPGSTRARYHFRLDLGGSLPQWMTRGRATKELPELFQAIRRQAMQPTG